MSRRTWILMAAVLGAACHDPEAPADRLPALLDPTDHDRDGHRSIAAGGDDCDDAAAQVFAGASETCDGRDEDCDGLVDDGFDCAPGDERPCGPDPGWVERCWRDCTWWGECDRAPPGDDDCTASEDNCSPGQPEACETACGEGQRTCGPGCAWTECSPPREWCNGRDDDCDGEIDEGTWSLGGAIAEHPWTGTTERFAAAVTQDGRIGIVQTTADREGSGVYLTWGVHDGPSLGPPISLTDDATDVRELAVTAAGPRVLCALGRPDRVDLLLVGKDEVEVSWTVDGDLPDIRLAAAGDESVVIAGNLLYRFDADGRSVASPVPLAEPVREVVWAGDSLVAASPGALEWLSLEGEEVARAPIDADAAAVVASAGDEVVAAFLSDDGDAALAGYVRGVEQWRATTAVDVGLTVDAVGWSHAGLMPSAVGPTWLVSFVTAGMDRAGWLVADGGEVRRSLTRWSLPRALERAPSTLVSGSSVNALVFGHDGVAAAPIGCHPDECSKFSWLANFRSGHASPFSAVIRFDDVSLEPKGFAFIEAGGHEPTGEEAARELAATMIGVDGELDLLEPRELGGNFVLRDDGDAGLDVAVVTGSGAPGLSVTRRSGERATFGFPEEFEGLSAMSGSCGSDSHLSGDGFDLDTGEPLDPVVLAETFRAADATPVPTAILIGGYVFAATAVRYAIDDTRAERAVVLWGGWLE